jgi:GH35 family endo-1,4-beta-xylanase
VGLKGEPLKEGIVAKIEQIRHKFLFGCNIFKLGRCRTLEDNVAYEKHFAALLNYATLPFYWWNYERAQDKPDYAGSEEILKWCRSHNVTTKGHPLAWNWVDPKWLPDDPEAAMKIQFERIVKCVGQFKGGIDIWDVVNEATQYDRPECKKNAPKLTEAIRRMGVGAYVRQAFNAARSANANATLVINDYRTDPAFGEQVISELVDNKRQSLYDVIGIQSHMHGGYWGPERTWSVCENFTKFEKPLHFTETTVVSGPRTDQGWNTTSEGEKQQAKQVAEFYTVLFSHRAVEAITWWDFTDQGAWQRAPAGFTRADMTPKPVYEELHRLIKDEWWTRCEVTSGPGGIVRLRGFFGEYKVSVPGESGLLKGIFRIDKDTKQIVEVRVS